MAYEAREVRFGSSRSKKRQRGDGECSWWIPRSFLLVSSAASIVEAVSRHWTASHWDAVTISVPPKFFHRRRTLWSRFPSGLSKHDAAFGPFSDYEGFFSVTPECMALHTAHVLSPTSSTGCHLDLFCGSGGDAIAAARTRDVIAVELNPTRLATAVHNSLVYGVSDRITFVLGDAMQLLRDACELLQSAGGGNKCVWIKTLRRRDDISAGPQISVISIGDILLALGDHSAPSSSSPSPGTVVDHCAQWRRIDVIFLAPPWGGEDYRREKSVVICKPESLPDLCGAESLFERSETERCTGVFTVLSDLSEDISGDGCRVKKSGSSSIEHVPGQRTDLGSSDASSVRPSSCAPSVSSDISTATCDARRFSLSSCITISSDCSARLNLLVSSAHGPEGVNGLTLLAASLKIASAGVAMFLPRSIDCSAVANAVQKVAPADIRLCFESQFMGTTAVFPVGIVLYASFSERNDIDHGNGTS
jgi:16S rRNA G966 N2-methylase RsmD